MNRETRMPLADGRSLVEQTVLRTSTLQLIGPQTFSYMAALDLKASWARYMRETEQNLTDLLPPEFSVRIREWDE